MSEIDREELRGLLERATPGPWLYDDQGGKTDEFELFYQDLSYTNGPVIASLKGREEDAQLIALAPTLAAAHLDLLERVDRYEEVLNDIDEFAHFHSTGPAVPDAFWSIRDMARSADETDGQTRQRIKSEVLAEIEYKNILNGYAQPVSEG